MKPLYTAYTKTINNTTFYFVKQFNYFLELKNVPPVLEKYGMHSNFEQACKIALVFDKQVQQQLFDKLENNTMFSKVLPLYPSSAEIYSFKRKLTAFSSIFKHIGLG